MNGKSPYILSSDNNTCPCSIFRIYCLLFFGLSFQKKRVVNQFYKWKFLHSKKVIKSSERADLVRWKQLISYLEVSSKNRLTTLNSMKIFTEGNQFFKSMINDLKKAEKTIYMEYYIFKYDELGNLYLIFLFKKQRKCGYKNYSR